MAGEGPRGERVGRHRQQVRLDVLGGAPDLGQGELVAAADMDQDPGQEGCRGVVPERVVVPGLADMGEHVGRHLAVADQVRALAQLEQRVEPGAVRCRRVEDVDRPEPGPPPGGDRRQLVLGIEHQDAAGVPEQGRDDMPRTLAGAGGAKDQHVPVAMVAQHRAALPAEDDAVATAADVAAAQKVAGGAQALILRPLLDAQRAVQLGQTGYRHR